MQLPFDIADAVPFGLPDRAPDGAIAHSALPVVRDRPLPSIVAAPTVNPGDDDDDEDDDEDDKEKGGGNIDPDDDEGYGDDDEDDDDEDPLWAAMLRRTIAS